MMKTSPVWGTGRFHHGPVLNERRTVAPPGLPAFAGAQTSANLLDAEAPGRKRLAQLRRGHRGIEPACKIPRRQHDDLAVVIRLDVLARLGRQHGPCLADPWV